MGADIDGEAAEDFSGLTVATSADGARVAVGEPYNDAGGKDSGRVRVLDWNGSSWVHHTATDG